MLGHSDPDADGFEEAANPPSPLDGRRMVEFARSHVWTWDARPYPWFPLATDRSVQSRANSRASS